MIINFEGIDCKLLAEKAVHIPVCHTLVVADLHLGKAAYFQENGLPITGAIHHNDLNRLSIILYKLQIQRLIILGDLFHHGEIYGRDLFFEFGKKHEHIKIDWVLGNHDKSTNIDLKNLHIQEEMLLNQMRFVHECTVHSLAENQVVFSGHEHPAIHIQHKRSGITLPCFVKEKNKLILPAFGSFTGNKKYVYNQKTKIHHNKQGRCFFAIVGEEIKPIG